MKEETIPQNCPYCQARIRRIPAGVSKRTGKPYGEFFACENRECKFVWHPKDASQKPAQPAGNQIVMDELSAVNTRLEKIWDLLKQVYDNTATD